MTKAIDKNESGSGVTAPEKGESTPEANPPVQKAASSSKSVSWASTVTDEGEKEDNSPDVYPEEESDSIWDDNDNYTPAMVIHEFGEKVLSDEEKAVENIQEDKRKQNKAMRKWNQN